MINYVFDVDCVLTGPRMLMDTEFEKFFRQWMYVRMHMVNRPERVYITSGSTYIDIKKQLGDIVDQINGFFACQGNTLYVAGQQVYEMVWHCEDLIEVLEDFLVKSPYPLRCGGHIDKRSGMLNFSSIGSRANKEQRIAYSQWDAIQKERQQIVDYINTHFLEVCATIGGQVSIDIAPHGCDKSQVRNKIKGPIYFFGDQVQEGGNDWLLVKVLNKEDKVFSVKSWQDTQEILRNEFSQ